MTKLITKYKRFLNYFNTFISVIINYLINNFDKINVNYFDKYLRKVFTNVNIINFNYFNKFEINVTIKIIEINIYEYLLFFIIIKDIKLIVNSE